MDSSFNLFTVRGIGIRIHWTFPLILFWAGFQYGQIGGREGAIFGLLVIVLLFVLVTLHELGHSFAALHYGVPVKQIVLLPIGGMAMLERMPQKPVQELVIAVAGPLVNVVFAVVMLVMAWGWQIPVLESFATIELTFTAVFSYMLVYNIMLAVFNLLPAFPMDGGRILRALLAMKWSYLQATAVAVNVGRVMAVLLVVYGLMNGGVFMLLIAFFIFVSGSQELMALRWRDQVQKSVWGFTVRQVYSPLVRVLGPYDNLQMALTQRLQSWQTDFPVAQDEQYLGFVTEQGLLNAANQYGPETLIYAAISPEVRPVTLETDLAEVQRQMLRHRIQALPVVEYGRLLGMITYQQIQHVIRTATPLNQDPLSRVRSA